MVLGHHTSFLLVAFGLYLKLSLDMVEAASCPAPRINASEVCEGVERNDVKSSPNLNHVVCDNLENLTQVDRTFILEALEFGLRDNEEDSLNILKALFSQVDGHKLEMALEKFHHMVPNSSLMLHQWKTDILRALWDEKLRNEERFNETAFVTSWFQERLRPFLSAISTDMLQCLHNETMQCAQFQAIVKGLDVEFAKMSPQTQEEAFRSFQLPYLEGVRSNGAACVEGLDNFMWLMLNFRRFSKYAKYQDLTALNSKFSGLDVLRNLTVKQLAQLSATGGALKTPADVQNVMEFVDISTVTEYIDEFNKQVNISLSKEIQASLLDRVLALVQPIFQKVDDAEFILWMDQRLPVLIPGLNSTLIPLLFDHLAHRNISAIHAVTSLLNGSIDEFNNATRQSIYQAILSVTSNISVQYYAPNSSFVAFLKESFQRFEEFLTLRDVESLIPTSDLQKIVNTIPADALADLFSRKGFLNKDSFLTAVLQNYKRNGAFMDKWNQKDIIDHLPNGTKVALLAGVWLTVVTSNNTEVDLWLGGRLADYFAFLNGHMLNASETLNASCVTFHKIISKLNNDSEVFTGREEELYYSIKAYLMATKDKPRCYNTSDPEISDWFVTYLGNYIRYTSARDMRLFTNRSAAIFQNLAFNLDNLKLITKTKIRKDLAEMYAAALFAVDSEFSLDSLPDKLLCFARHSALIPALSPADALSLIAQVNRHCSAPKPSASDRQLAMMLVACVKPLNGQTLVALGQQAVGLTGRLISSLTAQDLVDPKVLASLGQVRGWSRGQSQALVNKILQSNFTLDTMEKFDQLGTLAQGLPTSNIEEISVDLAIGLAKNPGFLTALQQGPEHLKKVFVSKILSNTSSISDILNHVPDDLVDQVPNSLLAFQGSIPDLHKINEKHWSPQQAAVFFGDVLSRTDNYTQLSPFVLQGFQCSAASELTPGHLSALAKEVKVKKAILSDEQLSCLAKLLTRSNWTMENLTHYPEDVLLFFPLGKVDKSSCRPFYALASEGNLSLLTNGSVQRTTLLKNSLSCFGVMNTSLSKQQLRELGALVCDMDAATIKDSDPGILENLKRCPDLTAYQRTALNTRLGSGKTLYGLPGSWDEGTLESLGPLAFYINSTTWNSINQEERTAFFRNVADGYKSQSGSQMERTIIFLKSVGSKPASSLRMKRAVETCQSSPITADTLEDPLFILRYDSAQQFSACLTNEVLKANLASLFDQPLPDDYLVVIRRKLDEIYPGGIPEDQLKLLGFLAPQYSVDAIGKWNVTSSDTLASLLNRHNGPWEQPQLMRLVGRYLELGGSLTGPVLAMLGGKYLCFLDEDQLKQINPESIWHAGKLNISSCSQEKKDLLYEKVHTASANQEGTGAYYPLIQPHLGGTPAEDLKKLTGSEIAMDIKTFTNLKSEELKKLSIQDVRSLLGVNLPDLKAVESHPSVALWIKSHLQSELDTLGIGLTGGMMTLDSTQSTSITVGFFAGEEFNSSPTVGTPVTPILGYVDSATSSITTSSNATTVSNTLSIGPASVTLSAASDSHSTPVFHISTAAEDRPTSVDEANTSAAPIEKEPRTVFHTNITVIPFNVTATSEEAVSKTLAPATLAKNTTASREVTTDSMFANSTAFPTTTQDSNLVVSTNFIATTSSSVTATSEDAVSRSLAPATVGYTASREATADSSTTTPANSTAFPTTTQDSNLVVSTNFIATTSSSVTATAEDAVIRSLAPATVGYTASREAIPDSSTTTPANSTAFPTTTQDSNLVVSTNFIATTSSSVTATSEDAVSRSLAPATVGYTASREATADSSTTTPANSTAFPTTTQDSNLVVSTNFIATTSSSVTATSEDAVSRSLAPATVGYTASREATADSSTTTPANSTAFPTTTQDSNLVVSTNFIATTSSSVTATSEDAVSRSLAPATVGYTASREATADSSTTTPANSTAFPTTTQDSNLVVSTNFIATTSSSVTATSEDAVSRSLAPATVGYTASREATADSSTTTPANSTAFPTTTQDSNLVVSTNFIATTSSSVTATSEDAVSRSLAPATVGYTASREATADSSTTTPANSTAFPTTTQDSNLVVSTNFIATTSSSVTATSEDAVSRSLAPATVGYTASREATADSSTTTPANSTAFPTTTQDSNLVVSTNFIATTSSSVTATSEDAVSRSLAPATVGYTASREATADSSTTTPANSTAFPTTTQDSNLVVSTNFIATTSSSVTATSEDAVSRSLAPATVGYTASREAIPDSSTTTPANSTALPMTTEDFSIVVPTDFVATSLPSITATSNDSGNRTVAAATDTTNMATSVETTDASSFIQTKHRAFPTSSPETNTTATINATNFHTLTAGTNHTYSIEATTSTVPSMTVASSEGPPAPPKPRPNATTPVPISTTSKTTHKTPSASNRSTVHVPKTSHKTALSPGPLHRTSFTATRRITLRRSSPKTKAPLYSPPNGYITIRPITGSASSPSLHQILPALFLAAGISVLRLLL